MEAFSIAEVEAASSSIMNHAWDAIYKARNWMNSEEWCIHLDGMINGRWAALCTHRLQLHLYRPAPYPYDTSSALPYILLELSRSGKDLSLVEWRIIQTGVPRSMNERWLLNRKQSTRHACDSSNRIWSDFEYFINTFKQYGLISFFTR